MVAFRMVERPGAAARRRPRRPTFLEHVVKIPLAETGGGPQETPGTASEARTAAEAPEPVAEQGRLPLPQPTPRTQAPVRPESVPSAARSDTPEPRGRAKPIIVDADAVNRPESGGDGVSSPPQVSQPPRLAPDPREGPLLPWLLGALTAGVLVGAVGGTVAALLLLG